MTLPSSGGLTIAQILAEIGDSFPVTIPNANWRRLAGKPSGSLIIPTDFYGKSWKVASFLQYTALGSGGSGSINFGTDQHSTRKIVLNVHWSEGGSHRTLSSATIGGVAATIHDQRGHTGGTTGLGAAVISATVPTGTSGTVALTFSGLITDSGVGAHSLTGGFALSTFGDDQSTVTTAALSVALTSPAKGVIIGAYTGSTNTIGTNVSWSNATEQYDAQTTTRHSGAFLTGQAAGPVTVGATQGVISNSGNDLVVTIWS